MQNKLMTKEIEKKLEKHPLYSTEGKGLDAEVIVKFFNPYGLGTWLITEGTKQEDGDWLLYGYCCVTDWEWGYISFNELKSVKVKIGRYELPLERDLYCKGTVRDNVR